MIIGEYVVNPLEVIYGKREWIPGGPTYRVIINIRTELGIMSLEQFNPSDKESKALMKLIEKCIEEHKKAIIDGLLIDEHWDDEEDD